MKLKGFITFTQTVPTSLRDRKKAVEDIKGEQVTWDEFLVRGVEEFEKDLQNKKNKK